MNKFQKDNYLVVRNLITKKEAKTLATNLKKNEKNGLLDDPQVPQSVSFYNNKLNTKIQKKLLPKIEKHTDFKLFKTYNYARIYKKNAILRIHKDRPACEISLTLDLGGDDWLIYLLNNDEKPIKVKLNPGDAIIYMGCDVWHWREKFKGNEHTQIFMHFVNKFGRYSWAKNDIQK
jgi:hypothetical protein